MKTIKIFLASSEELEYDRMAFGNLVRRLDKIYEKRGTRVELFEWEDYDAYYSGQRKQDEYNEQIKASDLFLALFHTQAGRYTIEEFDVATEEFIRHASPKVYVYCKDLQPGEQESPELVEFKKRLYEEMGHYWCRYSNRDTMQLHFVMQLQLVENSRMETLKVEENGAVTLDGNPVAHMDKQSFAAGNEAYQRMHAELLEFPERIEKARRHVEKYPDDENLRGDLQALLNRYNQLKEDFTRLQQNLFDTAKAVANLQSQQVNSKLLRAIEAFETGDLLHANAFLDDITHEADLHMEHPEQNRELIHQDIDAFQLQTKTVMADENFMIEDRISRVKAIFAKADDWAQRSVYKKEKHIELLFEYARFLNCFAFYLEAEQIYLRLIHLCEEHYGRKHPETAHSHNNIGMVYYYQGKYPEALNHYLVALDILEQIGDEADQQTIATVISNIGLAYQYQGDYQKALKHYFRALDIQEAVLDENHTDIARTLNNIGLTYFELGDYTKALEYSQKTLDIQEHVLGTENLDVARSYNNIGLILYNQGDYTKALYYYLKTQNIHEKLLGDKHPFTATTYNNLGMVYNYKGDYKKALENFHMALGIQETVLGINHPDTAKSYINIGHIYFLYSDYAKALEYEQKALSIYEHTVGLNHPDATNAYNEISLIYNSLKDYEKALEYSFKALEIRKHVFGKNHPSTAISYNNIGLAYYNLADYVKALEYYTKACATYEQIIGPNHADMATLYNNIGLVYDQIKDYGQALEYYHKALKIYEKTLGPNHQDTAESYNNLGNVYKTHGDIPNALEYYLKALVAYEHLYGPDNPNTQAIRKNIENTKNSM